MSVKEETLTEDPQSFSRLVATLNRGEMDGAASHELFELLKYLGVEARTRRGKIVGEITVKLTVAVEENNAVQLFYTVKRKQPPLRTMPAMKWLGKNLQLIDNDPRQPDLPLVSVPGVRSDIRSVPGAGHAGVKKDEE